MRTLTLTLTIVLAAMTLSAAPPPRRPKTKTPTVSAEAQAAQKRAAQKADAINRPWLNDPTWQDCANRITQLSNLIASHKQELQLVTDAGAGMSTRANNLREWIATCTAKLQTAFIEKGKIEAAWKLKVLEDQKASNRQQSK